MDWKGYETAYARFLPHINNNFDFQEMLSELLGELNGSHTGARYNPGLTGPETASLGAFFDNAYTGDGLKIEEIIAKGPADIGRQPDKERLYHREDRRNTDKERRRLLSTAKR